MARRSHRRRGGISVWLALTALAIQAFILQPHVDVARAGAPQAVATASSIDAAHEPLPLALAPACFVCQQAAAARTALFAAAPAIRIAAHALTFAVAPPRLPIMEARPTRPWQSRAPPILD